MAEQSQEAAKKIAVLIGEIRQDTEKAVLAMNTGVHDIQIGTEVVNTAGKTFSEIVGLVNTVSSQVEDISATVGKKTAEQTQTVSAATEEQSAAMEEISSSSQALSKLAEELQMEVRKFRV